METNIVPIRMHVVIGRNTLVKIFMALNLNDSPHKVFIVDTCYGAPCYFISVINVITAIKQKARRWREKVKLKGI